MSHLSPVADERIHEVAVGFRKACAKETGAHFVKKRDVPLHMGIAGALDVVGSVKDVALSFGVDIPLAAPRGDEYLDHFATTIGREVAVPEGWGDLDTMMTDPHECLHVWQFVHAPESWGLPKVVTHSILYLLGVVFHDKAGEEYMGKIEGDAYAVTQTVKKFLRESQTADPLEVVVKPLIESYNLLNLGPATARGILASHLATMEAGLLPNVTMARFAWDWLSTNAADLKGTFRF